MNAKRRVRLMRGLYVVIVATALAACGGSASLTEPQDATPTARPTATARPTPEPTPSPEPTPDLEALGEEYLSLMTTRNAVVCEFNEALTASPSDLPLLQGAAVALATAEREAADGLRAMAFPEDIQPLIDDVIANGAASAADDWTLANIELERASEISAEGSGTSNLVRGELGLTSVPADVCE